MKPEINELEVIRPIDGRKNTIFVAAGDLEVFLTFVVNCLSENYNIIVFYYGVGDFKKKIIKNRVNVILKGLGTKFNALKYINDMGYFDNYSGYIWVSDDDLVVSDSAAIGKMFDDMNKYGVDLASPSHSPLGKISFRHMRRRIISSGIRETNFIEMTCPIFSMGMLRNFLRDYDYSLAGWGVDWWYSWFFALSLQKKMFIFDYLSVFNPHVRIDGKREIDKYLSSASRRMQWEEKKGTLGFEDFDIKTNGFKLDFVSNIVNIKNYLLSRDFSFLLSKLLGVVWRF